jgi:hypothetical protein
MNLLTLMWDLVLNGSAELAFGQFDITRWRLM